MSLPVMNFPMLSFEQANPGLTAARSISDTLGQVLANRQTAIENQYLGPSLQQALQQSQFKTQQAAAEAPYYSGSALADYLSKQAAAQTSMTGAKFSEQKNIADILQSHAMAKQASAAGDLDEASAYEKHIEASKMQMMSDIIRHTMQDEQGTPQTIGQGLQPSQSPILSAGLANIGQPSQPTLAQGMQQQVQQNQPSVGPQQQGSYPSYSPLSQLSPQLQRELKLADILAATEGRIPPSAQAALELQKEMASKSAENRFKYSNELETGQAKDMEDMSLTSAKSAELAQNNIANINELAKYNNAATLKGPLTRWLMGLQKTDPNYVAALKSAAQLQLSGIKDLSAAHTGRILEQMIESIQAGNPTPDLPAEAVKMLSKQLMTANQMVIAKNNLLQKYKGQIQDPSALSTGISNFTLAYNPVDEQGNLHPEIMDKWSSLATPELMDYGSKGNALPKGNIKFINNKGYIKNINTGKWHEL